MNDTNSRKRQGSRGARPLVTALAAALLILGLGAMAVALAQTGDSGPTQPNSLFLPLVQQSSAAQATIAIDPRVLEDTANGQIGRFLVVLQQQAQLSAVASAAPDRASQAALRTQLDGLGASYHAYWVVNLLALEGNRAAVEAMAARPDVLTIESDRAFRVPLESPETVEAAIPAAVTAVEWNLSWINVPAVWALGDTGQNTVYATPTPACSGRTRHSSPITAAGMARSRITTTTGGTPYTPTSTATPVVLISARPATARGTARIRWARASATTAPAIKLV